MASPKATNSGMLLYRFDFFATHRCCADEGFIPRDMTPKHDIVSREKNSKGESMNLSKCVAIGICTFVLVGCGGGGSGGSTASQAPIVSTLAFPFKSAYAGNFNRSGSRQGDYSGTVNGYSVTGTASQTTSSPVNASFEGIGGFSKYSTTNGTRIYNGTSFPIAYTSTDYWDTNYNPLGSGSGSEYTVVIRGIPLPASVRVNDTNSWYSENRYSNAAKTKWLGTTEYSWAVVADTANTAIIKTIDISKDTSGNTVSTGITFYRIHETGTMTGLYRNFLEPGSRTNITTTYR